MDELQECAIGTCAIDVADFDGDEVHICYVASDIIDVENLGEGDSNGLPGLGKLKLASTNRHEVLFGKFWVMPISTERMQLYQRL
jgi:hypothetical protein